VLKVAERFVFASGSKASLGQDFKRASESDSFQMTHDLLCGGDTFEVAGR